MNLAEARAALLPPRSRGVAYRGGEALRTGLREILSHKFRSTLSFAAVSVGVGSILYTFGQTHGMRQALETAVTLMGPGRMQITAKNGYVSKGLSPGLTSDDAEELRRAMPELHMAYPKARRRGAVLKYGRHRVEEVPVYGVTQEWRKRDWVYALRGRFLNRWDVAQAARVCVAVEPGGWIQKPFWLSWRREDPLDLFLKRHDLLGRRVLLEDRLFTVVGVLKEPPKDLDPRWFHWEDNGILVPVTAFHRYLQRRRQAQAPTAVDEIEVDAGSEEAVPRVKRGISAILKRRHRGEEDYDVQDYRDMIQEELADTKRYILVGTVLGAVALLAGGIGIMNVTLAAVFSRVKEIGVRRALGATKGDILAQFVGEAALLGLLGGAAGLGLGLAGIRYLARQSERNLVSLTWYHMAGVLAIGVLICCLFSLYPAKRAAGLDPVAALKEE